MQHIRGRYEISIENKEKFAFGYLGPLFEGTGFITGAINAVQVAGIEALLTQTFGPSLAKLIGFVGGIIEDLNLQFILRIIELGDGCKQAIDHMLFIEYG